MSQRGKDNRESIRRKVEGQARLSDSPLKAVEWQCGLVRGSAGHQAFPGAGVGEMATARTRG